MTLQPRRCNVENFLKPINSHINALSTLFTDVPVFCVTSNRVWPLPFLLVVSIISHLLDVMICILLHKYMLQLFTQFRPGWIVMEREEERDKHGEKSLGIIRNHSQFWISRLMQIFLSLIPPPPAVPLRAELHGNPFYIVFTLFTTQHFIFTQNRDKLF